MESCITELATRASAKALAAQLVVAAQAVYNAWDESDQDTYAGGGICHLIAEALVGVLDQAGVESQTASSTFEQHVFVTCQLKEGVYILDIPYGLYERGAAFTWTKIQGVQFTEESLVWYCVDSNPEKYRQYLDD